MQDLRCHYISMSGKSPTKLEVTSRHDNTHVAVYWDVKHQIKQTNHIVGMSQSTCRVSGRDRKTIIKRRI